MWRHYVDSFILSTFNPFPTFLDRKRGGSMDNLLDDLDSEQMSADMKKAKSASTKNLNVGGMAIPGKTEKADDEEKARITSV